MSTVVSRETAKNPTSSSSKNRREALALVLEDGARALAGLAAGLSPSEWQTPGTHDKRKVGVIVHHVATMYPLEIQLAQKVAKGEALSGVTWDAVAEINAGHARDFEGVTKEQALDLLRKNSADAAAAIRALSDDELDTATPNSLYGDVPLTCQFFLEDHAVRHSWHHLAKLKALLKR
jgi:hypothetical protein